MHQSVYSPYFTYCTLTFVTYYFYLYLFVFFFNDTATTEIYTLSLHDALPIFFCLSLNLSSLSLAEQQVEGFSLVQYGDDGRKKWELCGRSAEVLDDDIRIRDRKSTRLNSSHIPLSRMPSSA